MRLDQAVSDVVRQVEALRARVGPVDGDAAGDLERVEQAAVMLRTELARVAAEPAVTAAQLRHDLRNPLGALIGYAELLAEDGVDVGDVRTAAVDLLERLEAL